MAGVVAVHCHLPRSPSNQLPKSDWSCFRWPRMYITVDVHTWNCNWELGTPWSFESTLEEGTMSGETKKAEKQADNSEALSPVLKSAPPPWHAQLIVLALFGTFAWYSPQALESMDEIATVETFSRTLFPSILSSNQVILLRLIFAVVLLTVNFYDFFLTEGFDFPVTYYEGSKLRGTTLTFHGLFSTCGNLREALLANASFSNWSVGLLGISFLLSGLIPFFALHWGWDVPLSILRLAVVCWIMAAPSAVLVSVVVKYVLWPHAMEQDGEGSAIFQGKLVLLCHNFNSISALVDIGLLGGLPCRLQDFAIAPLFGLIYVVFNWCMANYWTNDLEKYGPQFIYPFMDTTLGVSCTIAIVVLFLVFVASFLLFCFAEYFLMECIGGGIVSHAIAVVILCAGVCRFRD